MPFQAIAHKYDIFNAADTDSYADFICKAFEMADVPVREVLDLGCGTGIITLELARRGYDMIGVDISAEMLGELRAKTGSENVLLLMQDMRELDLYGTVQGTVCTFDCLNYLSDTADLKAALSSVALFTEPGGIFVFDVNTAYAYEQVYGHNCYVYEDGGDMLVWQNFYSPSTKKCRFELTLFETTESGYSRADELQTQRYFTERTIKKLLVECGFDVIGVYGSVGGNALSDTSPKAYYICKKRGF